jgi:hypothetical protein
MPREDETARKIYYGRHPPAWACAKCTARRLSRLRRKRNLIARLLQKLGLVK